jgi:hypothetical protein
MYPFLGVDKGFCAAHERDAGLIAGATRRRIFLRVG